MTAQLKLDDLDRRILRAVQRDASQPMQLLADQVGSTLATTHRRLQRLKQAGVIQRVVAIVDPAYSHADFTVLIGVVFDDQNARQQSAFKRFLREHPAVRMAWMTTGEFDYMLLGVFENSAAFQLFVDTKLAKTVKLKNFRSFVSLNEVRFDTSRPILGAHGSA